MDIRSHIPDRMTLAFTLAGGVLVAYTVAALLVIAIPELASLSHLLAVAAEPGVAESLLLTFAAGFLAVGILVLLGTPLAYLLARSTFRGRWLVESLIDIPLVLPHTVAGLMVYLLFMARGPIGEPLAAAGIFFEDAFPGIVAAMAFVAAPYYIGAVREGFARVPVTLEHVARTLGATRFRAFLAVALPLARGHLVSGALMAWGRAVGEFAAVVMIAYFPMVISTLIYQRFSTGGLAESRSVAFIMVAVSFLLFLIVRWVAGNRGRRHDHP
jgi:molybdate/tungstate transport system permease protein